jgi:hypothetical protein
MKLNEKKKSNKQTVEKEAEYYTYLRGFREEESVLLYAEHFQYGGKTGRK